MAWHCTGLCVLLFFTQRQCIYVLFCNSYCAYRAVLCSNSALQELQSVVTDSRNLRHSVEFLLEINARTRNSGQPCFRVLFSVSFGVVFNVLSLFFLWGAGAGGVSEVKSHAFFATINWDWLYRLLVVPPFKPVVSCVDDAFHFDTEFTSRTPRGYNNNNINNNNNILFGWTF